jgi:arginine decarboxylase
MGLKDLGDEMWQHMRQQRGGYWLAQAYSRLPRPELRPRDAFQLLMANEAELLPLEALANRVAGVGIIPYPAGIPIVMPGENIGPSDGPWLSYIRTLEAWGKHFPGFEAEVQGAEVRDGHYHIYCLKQAR